MGRKKKTRNMARCALMAAVIAVIAPFTIPVGTVPVSLATLAVMLAGVILPPVQSLWAVGTYLLCGAVGLPVFSGAQGGFSVFLGPTGGFLWGYLLCAFITSLCCRKKSRSLFLCSLGAFSASVCAMVCGALHYAMISEISLSAALAVCLFPFLPVEAVKSPLAVFLGRSVRRALDKQ